MTWAHVHNRFDVANLLFDTFNYTRLCLLCYIILQEMVDKENV